MREASNTGDGSNCPTLETLISILSGERVLSDSDPLLQHLESCPHCERAMDSVIARPDRATQGILHTESPISSDRLTSSTTGDRTVPVEMPVDSTRIPGFRIHQRVNKGGQGIVYKATELATGDTVALKWLPFSGSGDSEPANKEIAAAGRLDHPGIVKPRRQVDWSGQSVIVMDWVEGGDLRDFLDRGKLSIAESVDFVIRISRILEYAHDQGLIHRDLKPSNILLADGRIDSPRLTDFGLAKFEGPPGDFSTVTAGVGTPGYMAPELVSADFGKVGQATDIFSLGVILYELLTGELPFEGKTLFDFLRRTCDEPARPLRKLSSVIPLDLETICLKCLAKKQTDRYPNASDLRMDLERFRDGLPILAQRASRIDQLLAWAGRNPAVAVSATAAFVVLSASVVTLSILLERSRESQRIAESSQIAAESMRLAAENSKQAAEKSREVEEHSRQAAEQSLKLAVDAMKKASPIYKRFTQIANLNDDEQRNLLEATNLCLRIGDGSADLRVRCDSYFNTLQMASAIGFLPNRLDLAESITKQTLEKYRKLKNEHESELRTLIRGSSEGTRITALDTVNIRIAYCLIDLANIARKRGPDHETAYNDLVEQAIEQCERTLEENPTLEEAMAMLGQYLTARSVSVRIDVLVAEHGIDQALADLRKAVQYQKQFLDLKPSSLDRYRLYHGDRQRLIEILANVDLKSAECHEELQASLAQIRNLLSERPDQWKERCLWLLTFFSNLIIQDYDRTEPAESVRICEELLADLEHCQDLGIRDTTYRGMIFALWLDRAADLVNHGKIERARKECTRINAWLDSLGPVEKVEILKCQFRILAPLPEFRSIDEARRIADRFEVTEGDDVARIKSWFEIVDKGIPRQLEASKLSRFRASFETWFESAMIDVVFRSSKLKTDSDGLENRIDELIRIGDRTPGISPRWKCLLERTRGNLKPMPTKAATRQ